MKTNFLKSILFIALAAGFTTSCVNDDDYAVPTLECVDSSLQKTKEVAQIPASTNITQYLADDIIEAYVVSADKGGNFFKTMHLQSLDNTIAFTVLLDYANYSAYLFLKKK